MDVDVVAPEETEEEEEEEEEWEEEEEDFDAISDRVSKIEFPVPFFLLS